MREAKPDDLIYKLGYIIGERRQRSLPEDTTLPNETDDMLYEGKTLDQIDEEERLAWAKRVYRQSNGKINPYRE